MLMSFSKIISISAESKSDNDFTICFGMVLGKLYAEPLTNPIPMELGIWDRRSEDYQLFN